MTWMVCPYADRSAAAAVFWLVESLTQPPRMTLLLSVMISSTGPVPAGAAVGLFEADAVAPGVPAPAVPSERVAMPSAASSSGTSSSPAIQGMPSSGRR